MAQSEKEKRLVEFLYKQYKQLMFKTAVSILHNSELAEDAVHEAFLRVIKNLSKFSSYSCNENVSYLVIITRGIALNMINKQNKITELTEYLPSDDDIEAAVEIKLSYEQVISNIEKLSPALKNVATLYYVHGLTTNEIAEMLDMKINTVRVYLMRAKRTLCDTEME